MQGQNLNITDMRMIAIIADGLNVTVICLKEEERKNWNKMYSHMNTGVCYKDCCMETKICWNVRCAGIDDETAWDVWLKKKIKKRDHNVLCLMCKDKCGRHNNSPPPTPTSPSPPCQDIHSLSTHICSGLSGWAQYNLISSQSRNFTSLS